jgi:outer membrane protein OmpA-like peptidoglycan-associated protein
MTDKVPTPGPVDDSLDKIRELLIGQDDKYIEDKLNRNAKGVVCGVVSEALLERETKDGSVNKVLVPLVEKSLHRSIEANSDKIVGTLYPLVGTLVRKAVSAFLVDFVEKTNALIEHSLSPKSITWRFKAWQSGVRYSDYVASQVYQYQVQQLFVIHRETGTLLHTVSSDPQRTKDADLISSMLVAINDFVADAFSPANATYDNQLGEIKTEDFTLLITLGPQAILVAAVVGSAPPEIRGKLQLALEEFHQFYQKPLLEYKGDNRPFEDSGSLLNDCLVSEKKEAKQGKKKRWAATLLVVFAIVSLSTLAFFRIELALLRDNIDSLPLEPGIVLTRTEIENGKIHLRVLRDPAAPPVREWLQRYGVDADELAIYESSFVSLQNGVIKAKLLNLISAYPSLKITRDEANGLHLSGDISAQQYTLLTGKINTIPGITQLNIDTSDITITPSVTNNNRPLSAALAKQIAREISGITLNFNNNQNTLAFSEMEKLKRLTLLLTQLQDVAHQINLSVAVFIMGASDRLGTTAKNKTLSRARADNVRKFLVSNGIEESLLLPMGLGSLPLTENAMGRTVFLNVLISEATTTEDKNP